MAVGAPVGGVEAGTGGGEVLRQGDGGGGALRPDRRGHPLAGLHAGLAHGGGPAQADHPHQQGRDHPTEHQLAAVIPIASDQAEHQQPQAQGRREDAEGAAVADAEGHHPQQHGAEHRHAGAHQEQAPPAALGQALAGLPLQHQRQHRQQQHGGIGQEAIERQGLPQQAAPGAGEHLLAAVAAEEPLAAAAQGPQQAPRLEGDRAGVDHTDGGQHGHHHPHPALAAIPAATLAGEALAEAGGGHGAGLKLAGFCRPHPGRARCAGGRWVGLGIGRHAARRAAISHRR